ncbi:hypothetical protein P7K49_033845 [Saguinus oedipus]|uniref:Uncharacterized protein n=1 Tax=Saguinus oedipus TaxID=9490 RepID=A0ABQ9TU73_SAGOE|nr:hypothetical protein P7K49_033845 [Saguinus oedipus]
MHTSPKPPVGSLSSTNELTVTLCLLAPVDNPEECTLGSEEEKVTSDTEYGPGAARSMLVKLPAPYTQAWSTFPKALCPVEFLKDLVLEDIEDNEIPCDVLHTLQPGPHFPKLFVRFLGSTNALTVTLCSLRSSSGLLLGPMPSLEDIEDDDIPRDVVNGPAAARSMLVKHPAPYTPAQSTFPKALCEIPRQHQCADCHSMFS